MYVCTYVDMQIHRYASPEDQRHARRPGGRRPGAAQRRQRRLIQIVPCVFFSGGVFFSQAGITYHSKQDSHRHNPERPDMLCVNIRHKNMCLNKYMHVFNI